MTKKIENLSYRMVDEIVDRGGFEIESGQGWKENGAHPAGLKHQFKMALVERGFPDSKNESSPLLQRHIGRPGHQIVVIRVSDAGKGLDRAGNDDHSIRFERPAGNGGGEVLAWVDTGRQGFDLCRSIGGFFRNDLPGGGRDDQMGFNSSFLEHL